ncbi:Uu.00g046370.m01.CDS01 [Anthostomella pinea]|uniref:Uu.00g046370.m01.CDS01 n=1 Tax=Anthostomella pinea TaxID=933095 RepID=A0AAI8VBB5_9PEZI|nr:Uu.00g046370.m01.CDS01 [Anthostomella pinea]
MGNICGKSDGENFSQPGRVLGSAPPQPQRASIPAKVTGPPRTVGGGDANAAGASQNNNAEDARRRAAEAAEARANAASSKSTGKLGSQLAAQKKQTRNGTLQEISNNERRQRDADEAAETRVHS